MITVILNVSDPLGGGLGVGGWVDERFLIVCIAIITMYFGNVKLRIFMI